MKVGYKSRGIVLKLLVIALIFLLQVVGQRKV